MNNDMVCISDNIYIEIFKRSVNSKMTFPKQKNEILKDIIKGFLLGTCNFLDKMIERNDSYGIITTVEDCCGFLKTPISDPEKPEFVIIYDELHVNADTKIYKFENDKEYRQEILDALYKKYKLLVIDFANGNNNKFIDSVIKNGLELFEYVFKTNKKEKVLHIDESFYFNQIKPMAYTLNFVETDLVILQGSGIYEVANAGELFQI